MVNVSKLFLPHADPPLGNFGFMAVGITSVIKNVDRPYSLGPRAPKRLDVAVFFFSDGAAATQIEPMIAFILYVDSPLVCRILVDNGRGVRGADDDRLVGAAAVVKIRGRPSHSGIAGNHVTIRAMQPAAIAP